MAHLSLALLGSLHMSLDGTPVSTLESDKVRALLAYLALEADRPHRRAALAGLLWPERRERAAHLSLNQALSNLRRTLGDRTATTPVLRISPESVQFDRASDSDLDVTTFSIGMCLAGLAGVAGARGQPEPAARLLGFAEELMNGRNISFSPADRADYDRIAAAIRAQLDEATFAAAWAAGCALPLEQAITEALRAAECGPQIAFEET